MGVINEDTDVVLEEGKLVEVDYEPASAVIQRHLSKPSDEEIDALFDMDNSEFLNNEPPSPTGSAERTSEKLDTQQVCGLLGISRSTLLRLRKSADFPKAIQLNQRSQRWYRHELEEWERSRSRT